MSGHTSRINQTDVWLTPPHIIKSLGEFDLDPCSPINRPWDTAKEHYTIIDNGLIQDWEDKRVWLNPPYGDQLETWMRKMSMHMNGVSLIFARTDTDTFHKYVFPFADSILFLNKRIKFLNAAGKSGGSDGGAPSVLIAYGERNVASLVDCGLDGKHLYINAQPVLVVGFSPTWKQVVKVAFSKLTEEAVLADIYKMVEVVAPDKTAKNSHYRAKVRQTLQMHFSRISKGRYTVQQSLAL